MIHIIEGRADKGMTVDQFSLKKKNIFFVLRTKTKIYDKQELHILPLLKNLFFKVIIINSSPSPETSAGVPARPADLPASGRPLQHPVTQQQHQRHPAAAG